jgi:transcriptional regulator of acetoin/glycerol metabolism
VREQSDDQPFPLLPQTVVVSARAIEERIFREHFQYCWILAAAPSDDFGSSLLLAIDDQQSIIGGDQAAPAPGPLVGREPHPHKGNPLRKSNLAE